MSEPRYLLVKRGLYYRPDNHGYTGVKAEAGRYYATDAYDNVTAVHEDEAGEFAPACWQDTIIATLTAQRDELARQLEAAREVRDAMMDSQYLAGIKAGLNAAQDGDPEKAIAALYASREGHLAGFRKARATLARIAPKEPV